MTEWNLNRLRYTVRKLTGKYDITQLPDQSTGQPSMSNPPGIDDYLNDVYLYDFPQEFRTLTLKRFFEFTTFPNCGTYNVPKNIDQFIPPPWVDGYQCAWYQSPEMFYQVFPDFEFISQNLFTPDGVTTSFTFTIPVQNPPPPSIVTQTRAAIQQGSVVIGLQPNLDGNPSPQLETFVDAETPILLDQPLQERFTNPGVLTGNLGGTGTVNYLTGVTTVNYASAPPTGTIPSAHYRPYIASRPNSILYFQDQLFIRPIPNDTYKVKIMSYIQPTVAVSDLTNAATKAQFDGTGTDQTTYREWWQMLAYGAAIKIFTEDGDHTEVERLKGYYEEELIKAQRTCIKQLSSQRIPTDYAQNQYQGGGVGWPYSPFR